MTGLTRYELARQFRVMCGTSPYRYLLMRRLDFAREQLAPSRSLVEVALEAGFADQAHFSRMFKATFGITPTRYRALRVRSQQPQKKEMAWMQLEPREVELGESASR
jgi:AraC-like DNA-binding protein